MQDFTAARMGGQMHQPHRLVGGTATRTSDASYRHGEIRAGTEEGTMRHLQRCLSGYRAEIRQRLGANAQHVAVFRDLWTGVFRGFLAEAAPGDMIGFYPELLSPAFHYARRIPDSHGGLREETDRWAEALELVAIARDCWRDALQPEPAP